MAGLFKVPAPVAEIKRRLKRALSPQPSTSSAAELTPRECTRRHILHSVYEHLNIRLNDIGQLRGLKSGRRRGRWRRTQQTPKPRIFDISESLFNPNLTPSFSDLGLSAKFGDAMKLMEPLLMDEILTQQSQHTLVSTALDHFATVINHIVDEAEGDSHSETMRKRTALRRMFQDFEEDQPVRLDNDEDGNSSDNEDTEEKAQAEQIRFETAAAIFALLQGEETPEDTADNPSTSNTEGRSDNGDADDGSKK